MKDGIDYFPLDVALDDKFELIEAEFGLVGFSVIVKLFQKIYGGFGYYCEWTKDVALLFSKKIGLGGNAVSEIVCASIRRGIFNSDLYERYQILTSKGIQKRYFEAVSRRKKINVKSEYLLVQVGSFFKNVSNSEENVYISSENAYIFEQSREEESKEEKSKEKKSIVKERESNQPEGFIPPSLEEIKTYCNEINSNIDGERFLYYCQSRGWRINGDYITDWRAYLRAWEKLERRNEKHEKKDELLRTEETSEEFEKIMWERMQG